MLGPPCGEDVCVCVSGGYSFKGVTSFYGGHLERGEKICIQILEVGRPGPREERDLSTWMWGCSWSEGGCAEVVQGARTDRPPARGCPSELEHAAATLCGTSLARAPGKLGKPMSWLQQNPRSLEARAPGGPG